MRPEMGCREYNLKILVEITDNFSVSKKIGRGGFGEVYKGTRPKRGDLAVKVLDKSPSIVEPAQFKKKAENLTKLHHTNIVKLEGYCAGTLPRQRYLCFEYLSNGSLHEKLLGQPGGFDWGTHFEIIKGISSGLCYLHEQAKKDPNYIHLDLKPSNILLDSNMVPKIADFGLSSLFGPDETVTITKKFVESRQYMAPECLQKDPISKAADVFSFGMIILKVMTGKSMAVAPDLDSLDSSIKQYTEEVRQEYWSTYDKIKSRYPNLERHRLKEVTGCIGIGLQCAKVNLKSRPTAEKIVDMLDKLPQLEDGQNILFDESSGMMIGYRLLGRALNSPMAPSSSSRFSTDSVCRARSDRRHVTGQIRTRDLDKDTEYQVYLVYRSEASKVTENDMASIKLQWLPSGKNITTSRQVRLLNPVQNDGRSMELKLGEFENKHEVRKKNDAVTCPVMQRDDGRMELLLGEFKNNHEVRKDQDTVIAGVYDLATTFEKSLFIWAMEFRAKA